MPVIYIKDLVIEAKHGFHQREKEHAQRFRVNVELTVNSKAAETDDINDTVNWSHIRDKIIETFQNNSFNLVERLAQAVADNILANKSISKVVITIDKLDAFRTGVPGVRLEVNNS